MPEFSPVIFTVFLFFLLALIAIVDSRRGIIPDIAVIVLGLLAILATYMFGFQSWAMMSIGIIIGGGMLWGLRVFYKQLRGIDGLGLGDVKLMAVGGGLLGPLNVGYAIALGAAASLFWLLLFNKDALKSGQTKIPFGPGLCFGIFVFWVYGVRGGHYGS